MKPGPFLPIASLLFLILSSCSTEEASSRQSTATRPDSALAQVLLWSQQS